MDHSIFLKLLTPIATLASGFGKHKKLLILIYHQVLDKPDPMRPGEVDKAAFNWQMELISKYFNVLPLAVAIQKLQAGKLPSRAVCITFDDGYADNYTNALPTLKKFNLNATFFIAHGFLNGGRMWNDTVIEAVRNYQASVLDLTAIGLGRFQITDEIEKSQAASEIIRQIKHLPFDQRNQYTTYIANLSSSLPDNMMMSSEQVMQLHQSGMEIGGHTVNHPILAKLNDSDAEKEIVENKLFLENLLQSPVTLFAYPNGKPNQDYLPHQVQFVKNAGYLAAVSTRWGVSAPSDDRWQLARFTPWDNNALKFMGRIISNYY